MFNPTYFRLIQRGNIKISLQLPSTACRSRYLHTTVPDAATPLRGQTCLISGGSRGIGWAIASRFAASGASCVLLGRQENVLQERVKQLSSTEAKDYGSGDGARHDFVVGDVAKRETWEKAVEKLGKIDICVNAAGIAQSSLLVRSDPSKVVEPILQTNLYGTIWGCQILAKQMMRQKSGCIINISSLLAIKGGQGSSVYAASKAGVLALTRSLALEAGPAGVRVNAIVPGYIETDMTTGMTKESREQLECQIPLRRFGTVEEIADAAIFLATNTYANHCILNLDGGLSAV